MDEEKLVVPCEVYSRVVGYYRPIQLWNVGKKQEFKERKTFKLFREGINENIQNVE